jgi:hypothetical protein
MVRAAFRMGEKCSKIYWNVGWKRKINCLPHREQPVDRRSIVPYYYVHGARTTNDLWLAVHAVDYDCIAVAQY